MSRGHGWLSHPRTALWTFLSFLALQAAYFSYFHRSARMPPGEWVRLTAAALLILAALAVFVHSLQERLLERWLGRAAWQRWLAAALLGLMLGFMLPLHVRPIEPVHLEITALGQHSPQASSSEVWVRVEVDGHDLPASAFASDGNWTFQGAVAVSQPPHQPAKLTWSGRARGLTVHFVAHAWSGKVRIDRDGEVQELDLYRQPGTESSVDLQLLGKGVQSASLEFPHRSLLQWYAFAVDALLLGCLVTLLADVFVMSRRDDEAAVLQQRWQVGRWDWFLYGWPLAAVCLGYLLLFYPAVMTSDSLDQWAQADVGIITDWHPPLHTLMQGAVRLAWNSPAAIALVQIIWLSASIGTLIAFARAACGAPRWVGYLGTALCAIYPVIGLCSITLWKDVPYSAVVIYFVTLMIGMVCLKLPLLRSVGWLVYTIAAIVFCPAFRHNGLPVVFVTLIALVLLCPDKLRTTLVFCGGLALSFLITGPAMDRMGVIRMHPIVGIALHHVAGHLAAGQLPASVEDRDLLKRMMSGTLAWPYDCSYGGVTLYDPRLNGDEVRENYRRLLKITGELALSYPRKEISHVACVSALVWRLTRTSTEPTYLSPLSLYMTADGVHWISPNTLGIAEVHRFGRWGDRARRLIYEVLDHDSLRRPAAFLYLLLFAAYVCWRRQRNGRLAVSVVLVTLAQSGTLILFNVAQDPRYQFPIVLLALALAPLLLCTLARKSERGHATA